MALSACTDYQAAEYRLAKQDARTIKQHGDGDTSQALGIAQACIEDVSNGFKEALMGDYRGPEGDLKRVIQDIEPETLALCVITRVLKSVALGKSAVVVITSLLGSEIAHEVWSKNFKTFDKKAAESTEHFVRLKNSSLKQRRTAIRNIAKRLGFKPDNWSREFRVKVGAWALDILLHTTETTGLFVLEDQDGTKSITLSPGALEIAEKAWQVAIKRRPVFLPAAVPPTPWTAFDSGGIVPGTAFQPTLIRRFRKSTRGLVNAAIASGQMQPVLDALNTIQEVPWTINRRVLGVIRECRERGIEVPGLPKPTPYDMPLHPRPWDDMAEAERKLWRTRKAQAKQANRQRDVDLLMAEEDVTTAEQLAEYDQFYTPCNLDWRGRVYALPQFNFQRSDLVRSLFLFAGGEAIGEEGLWWLKVHVANCGDFDKISKRSFEERVAWTDQNVAVIQEIAENPIAEQALAVWTKADKPFLFLAAASELTAALSAGPTYVTKLPTSWDGSCSGLQHLCAMTRAPEGSLVNLTPQELPQDVYQTVAAKVEERLQTDTDPLAKVCTEYGVTRKLVKRNVMTYPYSSGKYGMGQQHRDDLMKPLRLEVLEGKFKSHPFGDDDGFAASIYLAGKVYDTIEETVNLPAQAMRYLQKLAKALAHEGKALIWVTPSGLPWENRYHDFVTKRVRLWLHDRGVRISYCMTLADGERREINKTKASNAVAPNFVHALDAAHLTLTVNACVKEGIRNFALVHDSFGCLASQAAKMHRIVREQFVQLYEKHDVLAEALVSASEALTQHNWNMLPDELHYGTLNLKDMIHARYAFA